MSEEKSTAEQERSSTAALAIRRLDPQSLLEKAIESNSSIEVVERLTALAMNVRAMFAREAWLAAMAQFQAECPAILKNKAAKFSAKGSQVSYTWASLDQLLGEMQPVAGPLGLSFSFQQKQEDGKALANCRISHAAGHSEESGWVVMPITQGDGTAATPQQQVVKAFMYAKRVGLLAVSGITPEDDPNLITTSASATPAPASSSEGQQGNTWIGKILNTKQKTLNGPNGPWTKYVLQTSDAQEFETSHKKHADFAKEAGVSAVEIVWTESKYGKEIVSIGPATA